MAGKITIRAIRPDDVRSVLAVHYDAVHKLGSADYTEEIVNQWSLSLDQKGIDHFLKAADSEIRLVAEINGEIVGFGAIVVPENEIRACYVSSRYARRGVGTLLVRELEKIAIEAGLDYLQLDSSLTAEVFYQRNGYESLERKKHILRTGLKMDAVRMRKNLCP